MVQCTPKCHTFGLLVPKNPILTCVGPTNLKYMFSTVFDLDHSLKNDLLLGQDQDHTTDLDV